MERHAARNEIFTGVTQLAIKMNLVVKNGSYTTRDGQEKHRYLTIGQLHAGQNGDYITLDAHINLAALPRKDGDTRVMVSLYEPREKEGTQPARETRGRQPAARDEFDDDPPY